MLVMAIVMVMVAVVSVDMALYRICTGAGSGKFMLCSWHTICVPGITPRLDSRCKNVKIRGLDPGRLLFPSGAIPQDEGKPTNSSTGGFLKAFGEASQCHSDTNRGVNK